VRELERTHGAQHMTRTLRRVLLRRPGGLERWREFGWHAEPDATRIVREHEALCSLLEEAGAEVVVAEPLDGDPDAVYVFDPALVADEGLVLLNPGKDLRRGEPEPLAAALPEIPVVARLGERELAEGGDTLWLDERTLLVGRSYRTDDAGVEALRRALPGVEVLAFDLPHLRGPGEVLHLLSLISPLDDDLAVVYLPLLPTRLVELLAARGVRLVEVPDEEFETMGPNVLALGPRVALAVDGNPATRRRMERAGVEVLVYEGRELSKGDGGPTCLTRPVLRG
jgi:dimethylargininase